jgi:hypothetical protein
MGTVKEELEGLAREFEEALVFNKPVLPVLLKATAQKVSIHIETEGGWNPALVRFRIAKETKFGKLHIDWYVDPEMLMTTVFYPKEG